MARPSIECERARLWISLAADAEISQLELAALETHLGGCPSCEAYSAQTAGLVGALRSAPLAAPERPAFTPRARGAWRLGVRKLHVAAAAAAVGIALALGGLIGTLSSSGPDSTVSEAANHTAFIQQSLLALRTASPKSGSHGPIIPS